MSLAQFAARRSLAQTRYAQFVADGIKAPSPWQQLKGQVFLGDEHFVEKLQSRVARHHREDVQIPVAHRRPPAASLRQIEKTSLIQLLTQTPLATEPLTMANQLNLFDK